ncbi:MAG TPA: sulfite exporter TauE/SafE family protein [Egibacteraceae bacterium]|nr:sulfite exporter TauE/SafE family protein [Egibacteraceae bacterium]
MLGSISPVGEAARRQRWWLTATAYTVASVLGGGLVGLAAGGLGQALQALTGWSPTTRLVVLALIAVVGAAADAGRLPWRLPTWRRQVDERWLTTYRGWVYGVGFGFQLGTGLATIVTSAATYVALAAAVLSGSVSAGVVVGVAFGLVRSMPLLLTGLLRTPEALHATTARLEASEPLARRLTVAGQLLAGVVAAVAAMPL